MRHLSFIFLMALLLLRGLLGDAMSTAMAATHAHQQPATKAADHAHGSGEQAPLNAETVAVQANWTAGDCSSHASDTHPHPADTHCESCSVCQACHLVALSPTAVNLAGILQMGTPPRTAVAQFSSAETALGEKPPIS